MKQMWIHKRWPIDSTFWKHRWLLLAFIVSIVVRVVYLLHEHNQPFWNDESEYVDLANALTEGKYVDDGKWLRPPLYPLFLSLCFRLTNGVVGAKIIQVVISVMTVGLLALLTNRLWDTKRITILTAWGAGLWIPVITHSVFFLTETLFLFLCVLFLLTLQKYFIDWKIWRIVIAGILLASMMLTRPIALLLLPTLSIVLGWATWRITWKNQQRVIFQTTNVVIFFIFASIMPLVPWIVRNEIVHHRFILLDTTGGYNAWLGNLPADGDTHFKVEYNEILNLADRQSKAYERAIDTIRADWWATIRHTAGKFMQMIRLESDSYFTEALFELSMKQPSRLIILFTDIQYLILVLAIIVSITIRKRSYFQIVLLFSVILLILGPLLTVVAPRLRIPALYLLIPYAALSIDIILNRQINRRSFRSIILLGCLFLVFSQAVPIILSQPLVMIARRQAANHQPTSAIQFLNLAQSVYPNRINGWLSAGELLRQNNQIDAALDQYAAVTTIISYHPWARLARADIYRNQGEFEKANVEIKLALLSLEEANTWMWEHYIPMNSSFVDIGVSDLQELGYIRGLNPAEHFDQTTYRWSSNSFEIKLPFRSDNSHSFIEINLASSRPPNAPLPNILLTINGTILARIDQANVQFTTYRIELPHDIRSPIILIATTDTFIPSQFLPNNQDQRDLGIMLDWIKLVQE